MTADYRRAFQPSVRSAAPYTMVALWTVCADTNAEAERLAASSKMMLAHLLMGELIPVPSPERAAARLAANPQLGHARAGRRIIAGSPATVRAGIAAAVAEYGADEAMLVNILYDHAAQRRSYELVAHAFTDIAVAA